MRHISSASDESTKRASEHMDGGSKILGAREKKRDQALFGE